MEESERNSLIAELESGTRRLDALRKDLEWREYDVEQEREKLRGLAAREDDEALKLIGPQIVVVEVFERVLGAERREYEELRARLEEIAKRLSE